jgi:hypothetical protein
MTQIPAWDAQLAQILYSTNWQTRSGCRLMNCSYKASYQGEGPVTHEELTRAVKATLGVLQELGRMGGRVLSRSYSNQ